MQKVGSKLTSDNKKLFSYSMVKYDFDGWADASLFSPADYDLVYLKIENKKKIIPGWYTGNRWDGQKLEEDQKVLFWKRKQEDE